MSPLTDGQRSRPTKFLPSIPSSGHHTRNSDHKPLWAGHGAQMQNTQRRDPKTAQFSPGEQRGSEGVTRSRCPARCQEPQGSESQPGRWLPSAPGTSCHCRGPAAPGAGGKPSQKPQRWPQSDPKAAPKRPQPTEPSLGMWHREHGDATRAATRPGGTRSDTSPLLGPSGLLKEL